MLTRRNMLAGLSGGAAASLVASSVPAAAQKNVNWRMQHFYGTEVDGTYRDFTDNVALTSGNTVKISVFRGSEITPNDQIFDAVKSGILQMGHGYGGYWPGQVDLGILESGVPGAWTSIDEAKYIFGGMGGMDLVREAYAEHGVHYLNILFGSGYELLTKEPVKSLDDLKSMRIRASSTMSSVLSKFDISTVYIPTQELYIALSTGAIDGVIYGSPLDYQNMRLFEVAKYYTSMNILNPGVTENIFVNRAAWDSLDDQQRKAIELSSNNLAEQHHNWLEFGSRDVVQQGNAEFSSLNAEDTKRLIEASQVVWDEEAKRSARNQKFVDILRKAAVSAGRL